MIIIGYVAGGAIVLALFIYLAIALLKPEMFP
jgi:K+-transporting ATPase KdpF subunit